MGTMDLVMLIFFGVVALGAGFYFLNKWASKRMTEQQSMIDRHRASASIFVIDKQKIKASESNMPSAVIAQLPRVYKFMKMPLVKAKVGAQIVTLMCDKNVYEALPVKKTVKVELAGMYIVGMPGMKSKEEMKKQSKAKSGGNNIMDKIVSKFKKS